MSSFKESNKNAPNVKRTHFTVHNIRLVFFSVIIYIDIYIGVDRNCYFVRWIGLMMLLDCRRWNIQRTTGNSTEQQRTVEKRHIKNRGWPGNWSTERTPEEQDLTNSGKRDATAGEQRTTGKRSWWTDTQKTAIMKDNWNMSWMDWKNKKLPFSEQWTVEKQKTMNGELQENRGNEQIATGN